MTKTFKNLAMFALVALIAALPELSFAQSGGTFETTICKVYNCFFGNKIVVFVATVAIIFLGIGAFFGKLNWGLVVVTIIGIVIVAGASKIAIMIARQDGTTLTACSETCG